MPASRAGGVRVRAPPGLARCDRQRL